MSIDLTSLNRLKKMRQWLLQVFGVTKLTTPPTNTTHRDQRLSPPIKTNIRDHLLRLHLGPPTWDYIWDHLLETTFQTTYWDQRSTPPKTNNWDSLMIQPVAIYHLHQQPRPHTQTTNWDHLPRRTFETTHWHHPSRPTTETTYWNHKLRPPTESNIRHHPLRHHMRAHTETTHGGHSTRSHTIDIYKYAYINMYIYINITATCITYICCYDAFSS